jgi:hypothetical protein
MGLDMFAFTTADEIPQVDFEHPDDATDLFYWRGYWKLHSFMEQLYRNKEGVEDQFNCVFVRVDSADLDILEADFKISRGSRGPDDEHFIHKARDALAKGKRIYYAGWW